MYTFKNLRSGINEINLRLESIGSTIRYVCGSYNDYKVVDEYSVDGGGINRNVCCGSSRSCYDAAMGAYYDECHRINRQKIEFADYVIKLLSIENDKTIVDLLARKACDLKLAD